MWNRILPLTLLAASACVVPSGGDCVTNADCLDGAVCQDGLCRGGDVPTAKIDVPASVPLGSTVTLDGSGSTSGTGVRYEWTMISPEGLILAEAGTAKPSFVAAQPHGTYTAQLVVVDRGTRSAPVQATVAVANTSPVARLVAPQARITRNATFEFDASTSTDPDGDPITYAWRLEPEGDGYSIAANGAKATVQTGAAAKSFKVVVVVSDDREASATADVSQAIDNTPPVVSAGAAVEVEHVCAGEPGARECKAQGSVSGSVADGDDGQIVPSSVAWTLKSSPPAAASAQVRFTPTGTGSAAFEIITPENMPIAGAYEFQLSAADNDGASSSASVIVTVGNRPPVVTLGGPDPLVVPHGFDAVASQFTALVPAAAVATDPDGDAVSFTFLPMPALPAGATATLIPGSTPGAAEYRLGVPRNLPGLLIGSAASFAMAVSVSDVNGGSASATRPVTVSNREPVAPPSFDVGLADPQHNYGAVPGVGGSGLFFRTFEFDYALSDPDGDPLDGVWGTTTPVASVVGGTLLRPALTPYGADPSIVLARIPAVVTAFDPFGATVTGEVALFMGDREPQVVLVPEVATEGHEYGPSSWANATGYGQAFDIPEPTVFDPDGDPTTLSWTVGSPNTARVESRITTQGGRTLVELFSTSPLAVGAPIPVTAHASDGFTEGAAIAQFTFGNRAPSIGEIVGASSAGHVYGAPTGTTLPAGYYETFALPGLVTSDPDGDPITASATAASTGLAISAVVLDETPRNLVLHSTQPSIVGRDLSVAVTAHDPCGGFATSGTAIFRMANRAPLAPVLTAATTPGHQYGVPPGTGLPAGYHQTFPPATVEDPDGDPLNETVSANGAPAGLTVSMQGTGAARAILMHSPGTASVGTNVSVTVTTTDPFGLAATSAPAILRMNNRAPTSINVKVSPVVSDPPSRVTCTSTGPTAASCTALTGAGAVRANTFSAFTGTCSLSAASFSAFTSPVGVGLLRAGYSAAPSDPDGDPLEVTFAGPSASTGALNRFVTAPGGIIVPAFSVNCTGPAGTLQDCSTEASLQFGYPTNIASTCRGATAPYATIESDTIQVVVADSLGATLSGALSLTVAK